MDHGQRARPVRICIYEQDIIIRKSGQWSPGLVIRYDEKVRCVSRSHNLRKRAEKATGARN